MTTRRPAAAVPSAPACADRAAATPRRAAATPRRRATTSGRWCPRRSLMVALVAVWMVAPDARASAGSSQDRAQDLLYREFRAELAAGHGPDRARSSRSATRSRLLRIPHIGVEQVVVEGTASGDLLAGPGHRRDTVLPGQVGTSVGLRPRERPTARRSPDIAELAPRRPDQRGRRPRAARDFARHRRTPRRRPAAPAAPEGAARLTLVSGEGERPPGPVAVARTRSSTSTPRPTRRFDTPAGLPRAVPDPEQAMATEPGAVMPLLTLCLGLLLALTLGVVAARQRWSAALVWVVATPVVIAVAWAHHRRGDAPAAQPDRDRPPAHQSRTTRPSTTTPREERHDMSVRRLLAGVAAAAVAGRVRSRWPPRPLADPTHPASPPPPSDIIGVGSDTIRARAQLPRRRQRRHRRLERHRPGHKLVSWNATPPAGGTATINLPSTADATRPNGSGAGKATLYGAGNNPDIDFARSSSAPQRDRDAGRPPGLPVRHGHAGSWPPAKTSNAPTRLTAGRQIVGIYNGTVTNWSRASAAPPASSSRRSRRRGSGTRSFFVDQLKAANGGIAVTLGRHRDRGPGARPHPDPGRPQRDRAVLDGPRRRSSAPPLRIEGGFAAAPRALQRGAPGRRRQARASRRSSATDGFVCSTAATHADRGRRLRAARRPDARRRLRRSRPRTATSNFATTSRSPPPPRVAGTSTSAGRADASPPRSRPAAPSPDGTRGVLPRRRPRPRPAPRCRSPAARRPRPSPASPPGAHTVIATFTPTATRRSRPRVRGHARLGRRDHPAGPGGQGRRPSSSETFKKAYAKGASVKGKVVVKESGDRVPPPARSSIKLGSEDRRQGHGQERRRTIIKLAKPLKKGKNKLVAQLRRRRSAFAASKLKFVITIKG